MKYCTTRKSIELKRGRGVKKQRMDENQFANVDSISSNVNQRQNKKRKVVGTKKQSGTATNQMISAAIGSESEEDPFQTDGDGNGDSDQEIDEPKRKGKKISSHFSGEFSFYYTEFRIS